MLTFDEETNTRLIATMELDFDPTGSSIAIKVDGTWYDAVWLGTPVNCDDKNEKWVQEAQTIQFFAGPGVPTPGSAVVLTSSPRHRTKTRITLGSDIITHDSSQIAVE